MLLPNLAAFATLPTIIIATTTLIEDQRADNGTVRALAKYEVNCRKEGNTLPRCYKSASAGYRYSTIGVYNSQDAECQ